MTAPYSQDNSTPDDLLGILDHPAPGSYWVQGLDGWHHIHYVPGARPGCPPSCGPVLDRDSLAQIVRDMDTTIERLQDLADALDDIGHRGEAVAAGHIAKAMQSLRARTHRQQRQ